MYSPHIQGSVAARWKQILRALSPSPRSRKSRQASKPRQLLLELLEDRDTPAITNPGFEALPDLTGWTVSNGQVPGTVDVVRDGGGTEGLAYVHMTMGGSVGNFGTGYGPLLTSDNFDLSIGQLVSVDFQALSGADDLSVSGYLRDAVTHDIVATLFDVTSHDPLIDWNTVSVSVSATGQYYLEFQVGSYDATGGTQVGATLNLDNLQIGDGVAVESPQQEVTEPIDTVDIEFSAEIDPDSFSVEDLVLTSNGGPNLISEGVTITQLTPTRFQIGGLADLQERAGVYELSVDTSGINLLSTDPYNETVTKTSWILDFQPGAPIVDVTQPTPGTVFDSFEDFTTMQVTFGEELDPVSAVDPNNYMLERPDGTTITPDSVELDDSATTVTLHFAEQDQQGEYTLLAGGIKDLAGNQLEWLEQNFRSYNLAAVGSSISGVGDFNEDGYLDFVFKMQGTRNLRVLLNNGDGTFSNVILAGVFGGTDAAVAPIQVGDVDQDGHLDVVVAHNNDDVGIYWGRGDGTFNASTTFNTNVGSSSVVIADVDNNGTLDLAVGGSTGLTLFVNPEGATPEDRRLAENWTASVLPGTNFSSITLADLNGDELLDVVGTDYVNNVGAVAFQNDQAPGSFTLGYSFTPFTVAPASFQNSILVDINGDDFLDLVSASNGVDVVYGTASGFDGQSAVSLNLSPGRLANTMVAADYDGDGDLDLVRGFTDPTGGMAVAFNENGIFTEELIGPAAVPFNQVVAGDFTGDGVDDLMGSGNDGKLWAVPDRVRYAVTQFAANVTSVVPINTNGKLSGADSSGGSVQVDASGVNGSLIEQDDTPIIITEGLQIHGANKSLFLEHAGNQISGDLALYDIDDFSLHSAGNLRITHFDVRGDFSIEVDGDLYVPEDIAVDLIQSGRIKAHRIIVEGLISGIDSLEADNLELASDGTWRLAVQPKAAQVDSNVQVYGNLVVDVVRAKSGHYGQAAIDGAAVIDGANLSLNLNGYDGFIGDRFTILTATQGISSTSMQFFGNAAGNRFVQNGLTFEIQQSGGKVELVLVAMATPPSNTSYVRQLYWDVLGRQADTGGLDHWVSALSSGEMSRDQVASNILQSPEYRRQKIEGYYELFLGRHGEEAGLQHWMAEFASGATEQEVIAGFVGSSEFKQIHGASNDGFIEGMYQALLGRNADQSGMTTWNQQLSDSASREEIVMKVLESKENQERVVDLAYEEFLRRNPGQLEANSWVSQLDEGWSDDKLMGAIAASKEYYSRT